LLPFVPSVHLWLSKELSWICILSGRLAMRNSTPLLGNMNDTMLPLHTFGGSNTSIITIEAKLTRPPPSTNRLGCSWLFGESRTHTYYSHGPLLATALALSI
jgi:hypothetical protein